VPAGELVVLADSSLAAAFQELDDALIARNPALNVTFTFSDSERLTGELRQTPPVNVFAAAGTGPIERAGTSGRIEDQPILFATNTLAIIVPVNNPAGIAGPADLAREGIRLVVVDEETTAGAFTWQFIEELAATAGFDAGYADAVQSRVTLLETATSDVLRRVANGEADAGIVYQTDVDDSVLTIGAPEESRVVVEYHAVLVAAGDPALGQAFLDILLSPEGRVILDRYGFGAAR
jgi:molybdate transport system substrate-binding protein